MVPWAGAEKLQSSGQLTQLTIQNADLFHDLTMKNWGSKHQKGMRNHESERLGPRRRHGDYRVVLSTMGTWGDKTPTEIR